MIRGVLWLYGLWRALQRVQPAEGEPCFWCGRTNSAAALPISATQISEYIEESIRELERLQRDATPTATETRRTARPSVRQLKPGLTQRPTIRSVTQDTTAVAGELLTVRSTFGDKRPRMVHPPTNPQPGDQVTVLNVDTLPVHWLGPVDFGPRATVNHQWAATTYTWNGKLWTTESTDGDPPAPAGVPS